MRWSGPNSEPTPRYVGHLGIDALVALVGGSAVAVATPVWDEPYGLVVAEALAAGTPVAAFARGGVCDIVDSTCGVWLGRTIPARWPLPSSEHRQLHRPRHATNERVGRARSR